MRNRIRELREQIGLTQGELAEKLGVHWQTVQRLETGGTELTIKWLERLGPALRVQPLQVIDDRAVRMVSMRGCVQAGAWAETWEIDDDDQPMVAIPDDPAFRNLKLFAVETRGPSMNRVYPEGTVLVVSDYIDHAEPLAVGRRYIVERERPDGLREATVKTLWQDRDGKPWLLPESDDPMHQQPIAIDSAEGDTIRILGRVVFMVRREP